MFHRATSIVIGGEIYNEAIQLGRLATATNRNGAATIGKSEVPKK